ncbi:MAG: (2Fe-2S) ferredoxin domain-containing protein, partial [Candidatus Faecousia sp.]|nr:(2Fe-2S) ferredoxin domain-containing protein [Candidatus Faecousia sp.]
MREKLNSLEAFKALQEKCIKARENEKRKVLVCCGTGCAAGGNLKVYEELKNQMALHDAAFEVTLNLSDCAAEATGIKKSGCHGFWELGPLVRIEPEGWLYTKVRTDDVKEIV